MDRQARHHRHRQRQRWDDVSDEMKREKANVVWDGYVGNLMKGKTMIFQEDAFRKMTNFLLPIYFKTDKEEKEMLSSIYWNDEKPNVSPDSSVMDEKKFTRMPFFTLDGKSYTVDDFKNMLDTHPLVFRKKKMGSGEFTEQLKYAIADMIRDRFVTQKAYDKGIDGIPTLKCTRPCGKTPSCHFTRGARFSKPGGSRANRRRIT